MTQTNLLMNQKQTQRETHMQKRFVVSKGERGWERDGLGAWDQQMQTTVYRRRINNKVTLYRTENYIQYPMISHSRKEYKKNVCVCIYRKECVRAHTYITESLFYIAEINTVNQL